MRRSRVADVRCLGESPGPSGCWEAAIDWKVSTCSCCLHVLSPVLAAVLAAACSTPSHLYAQVAPALGHTRTIPNSFLLCFLPLRSSQGRSPQRPPELLSSSGGGHGSTHAHNFTTTVTTCAALPTRPPRRVPRHRSGRCASAARPTELVRQYIMSDLERWRQVFREEAQRCVQELRQTVEEGRGRGGAERRVRGAVRRGDGRGSWATSLDW